MTYRMSSRLWTWCSFVLIAALPGLTAAQPPQPIIPVVKLALRPGKLPTPILRYELLPTFRDQVPGNAAVSYYRAIMMLGEHRLSDPEKNGGVHRKIDELLQKPLHELPVEEVRKQVQSYRRVYRELELAAKRERCDWDLERRIDADGIGVLLPEVQKIRELARLLTLRCRLHRAEGNFEEALKDVQIGFTMGRHIAEGPTLIQSLVGIAVLSIFANELEPIIQQPGVPNLYWSLAALPRPMVDLRKPLEGEVRMIEGTLPMLKEIEKGPMTAEQAQRTFDQWTSNTLQLFAESRLFQSKFILAAYVTMQYPNAEKSLLAMGKTVKELDAMPAVQVVMLASVSRFKNLRDEAFAWFYLPYSESREGMRRTETKIKNLRTQSQADWFGNAFLQLLPALEKVHLASIRIERRIAVLRVIEAIRLHAAMHEGKLPATLAEIEEVPVPNDPVTGRAFEYALKEGIATLSAPPPEGQQADQGNVLRYEITIGR